MPDDAHRMSETSQIYLRDVLPRLSDEERKVTRLLESTKKKIVNAQYAVIFNQTCITENLLPHFTNFRLYDRAAQRSELTLEFRRKLIEEELGKKKQSLRELYVSYSEALVQFNSLGLSDDVHDSVLTALRSQADAHRDVVRTRVQRKLAKLYGSKIAVPETKDCFINLSDHTLTDDERELLNLGLNCHYLPKVSRQKKKAELELLYQQICQLERNGKISVNPDVQEQLQSESTKIRGTRRSSLISPRLRQAARGLQDNESIVVRRADKAAIFVILNRDDYFTKVRDILNDGTKFKPLQRNPTDELKKHLNSLIDAANDFIDVAGGGLKFDRVTGEFSPGYFYGNIKTHKDGYPIRPIISQIPTPSYQLAKKLNSLIAPYVPTVHSLKSPDEFIEILKVKERRGLLASLDAKSLFTNVPIDETIDIIIGYVYHHPTLPPLPMPSGLLKEMLGACTREAPFRSPEGRLYLQVDGVAMGSPLGVLFAESYMSFVETEALAGMAEKPYIYSRYLDDIFVDIKDEPSLMHLKEELERHSVLTFTTEVGENNTLAFLDIDISAPSGQFNTSVYRKPTNSGHCLNGKSECPSRYKQSVIKAYIHRAFKHASSWELLHQELDRVRQILADNSYSQREVDAEIQRALDKHINQPPQRAKADTGTTHTLLYENQMNDAYKTDERVLRNIIRRNCDPTSDNDKLNLTVYYKSPKVSGLVMKNNLSHDSSLLKQTNVVYQYKCTYGDCARQHTGCYIGHTRTTLGRRLTMHLQDGGPKRHHLKEHAKRLTRDDLVSNTKILCRCSIPKKLQILEAVYIRDYDPTINRQVNARGKLQLFEGPPLASRE